MTRLAEKLRLSLIITKSTNSISLQNLSRIISLSIFNNLFKSLTRLFPFKTLATAILPSMDDDFLYSSLSFSGGGGGDGSNNFLDLDLAASSSSSSSNRQHLYHRCRSFVGDDDDNNDFEKLYLVPYRWWREAECSFDQVGVLYNVLSRNNDDDDGDNVEIVLNLRKEVDSRRRDGVEQGYLGREYALISGAMWLQALKWYNDSKSALKDVTSPFIAEDDFFPLQIRLSVAWETNSLVVKISLKDNTVAFYGRACNIFSLKSQPLHIWDFSGQTTQFLTNDRINLCNGSVGQSGDEILLELQVYGFSDSVMGRDEKFDAMLECNRIVFGTALVKQSGSSNHTSSYSTLTNSLQSGCGYRGVGFLGLTGLQNLGSTCFMNSAIQCLAHTPELVDYFLGDYGKDVNRENPLGMNGELALAFGDLLRKLWAPGATAMAPRMFKLKLANFAPQFSGYNQHDAQEFLAFLLDGLHEDLNRVKCKPYIEVKDAEGRPDEEVAEEYWRNHLARNDSIIVDLCQGQYRSTLVCPVCKKSSVTFDPFMYLSLPLPSTMMRTMTLTVLSADGNTLPYPVTITVPMCWRLRDLIEALSTACSLRNDETLLVAEIYKNKIVSFLEKPSDSLALIRDDDKLVAYRLLKDNEASPLVVFMHERLEKPYEFERAISNWKLFGIPLVARFSDVLNGFDLHKQFLNLLNPFLMPTDDVLNDYEDGEITAVEASAMEDVLSPTISDRCTGSDSEMENGPQFSSDFHFCLADKHESREIKINEQLPVPKSGDRLDVLVRWSDKMIEKYDTCLLSSLPEVFKPQLYTRRPLESVSLYRCLEAFLKEEPLGPEDMWYCPNCKKPQQASKKLDLWRLPEILVIHLKRFSYSRFMKNKLETYVDFPIDDLDLSTYISHKDGQFSNHYKLYAISNHYGGMGGGHYTAFVDHGHSRWFEFDDDKVFPVSEDRIKSSAAYVLFYRRIV